MGKFDLIRLACLTFCACVSSTVSFVYPSHSSSTSVLRTRQCATFVDNFVELESFERKQIHRTVDEATWLLLNGTHVGEMNRSHFQAAEMVVEAWSKRQTKRGALVVERLLRRIVKEQMVGNPYADCVDMTSLYSNLIEGWANCGEPGAAERAEEILDYLQNIYEEGDSYDPLLCGPGLRSFNAVIGAYARSGRDDAPQQAIRVLSKLCDLRAEGRTNVSPNKETYARKLSYLKRPAFCHGIQAACSTIVVSSRNERFRTCRCSACLGEHGNHRVSRISSPAPATHEKFVRDISIGTT
jgi:hypothetical protein